ncbi:MAG: hypothetical protein IIB88_06125 [Chloroflexi bacterium]|nr:hypothetical protein [Chloroflexota bacterium]
MFQRLVTVAALLNSEEGHGVTLPATLGGMAGAVLLAVGAVNNQDVLTIIGGVVLAVGLLASSMAQHMLIEYPIYERLDKMEGKE